MMELLELFLFGVSVAIGGLLGAGLRDLIKARLRKRVVRDITDPADLLDAWAQMLEEFMAVTPEDIDANGHSDHDDTRAKIRALRMGRDAIRREKIHG